MKDRKFYMDELEMEAYRNGLEAWAIEGDSYYGLIKEYGEVMEGMNNIVKVRGREVRGEVKELFGRKVIKGWYKIKKKENVRNDFKKEPK